MRQARKESDDETRHGSSGRAETTTTTATATETGVVNKYDVEINIRLRLRVSQSLANSTVDLSPNAALQSASNDAIIAGHVRNHWLANTKSTDLGTIRMQFDN